MNTQQLDLAGQFQIGSFLKTRKSLGLARRFMTRKYTEFIQEVNHSTVKNNRFYVPQRHA